MMLIKMILLLVLSLSLSLAQAQVRCSAIVDASMESRVENWDGVNVVVTPKLFEGQWIEMRRVQRSQLIGGHSMMGELLGGDTAFFIGLNSGGHMYLVSNVYRYDGKFGFDNSTLRQSTSVLDRGIVLRIQDRDGSIQDQIINYLKQNGAPRAINCAAGVCRVMNESSQIRVARNLREVVLPSALIKRMILDGVRGSDGQQKKVQLFMIGNAEPETVIQSSDRLARRYYEGLRPYVVTAATASVALIATFISWFM